MTETVVSRRRLIVTDDFPLELIDLQTTVDIIPFITDDPVDYIIFMESQVDEIVNSIKDDRIVEELQRRGVSAETWTRSRVDYLSTRDLVLILKMKNGTLAAWLVSIA
jgi:hypothetical protein